MAQRTAPVSDDTPQNCGDVVVDAYVRTEDDDTLSLDLGEIALHYSHQTLEHSVSVAGVRPVREAVRSWSLIGCDLALEFDQRSASILGLSAVHRARLDLALNDLVVVRDTLVEILEQSTCFVVDCAGRHLSV